MGATQKQIAENTRLKSSGMDFGRASCPVSPMDAHGKIFVPSDVRLGTPSKDGKPMLEWRGAREDLKAKKVGPGCLEGFISLGSPGASNAQIVQFARQWGPLALRPRFQEEASNRGETWFFEPLLLWRRLAGRIRAFFALDADLRKGAKTERDDWVTLLGNDARRVVDKPREHQKQILAAKMNEWVEEVGCKPQIEVTDGNVRLTIVPNPFLNYFWVPPKRRHPLRPVKPAVKNPRQADVRLSCLASPRSEPEERALRQRSISEQQVPVYPPGWEPRPVSVGAMVRFMYAVAEEKDKHLYAYEAAEPRPSWLYTTLIVQAATAFMSEQDFYRCNRCDTPFRLPEGHRKPRSGSRDQILCPNLECRKARRREVQRESKRKCRAEEGKRAEPATQNPIVSSQT